MGLFIFTLATFLVLKLIDQRNSVEVKVINVYPWVIKAELRCDYIQSTKGYKFNYNFNILPFATTSFVVPRKSIKKCEIGITYSSYVQHRRKS